MSAIAKESVQYNTLLERHKLNLKGTEMTELQKKIANLETIIKIECSDGNWNYDEYMLGTANGLILALSILTEQEPEYLSAPDKWLKDDETLHELTVASNPT